MNNFGTANFLSFVIDAWKKHIFNAIMFIHVAFANEIKVFSKICIGEISSIPLILYFSYIFTFNSVLEIISRTIF